MAALGRGSSVLVSAPTGVGKTVIAEMAIDRALSRGESALYASPLKALSNQKYRDFCERYGPQRAGILTGDVQENPAAPLLVLTTEILHNKLLRGQLTAMNDVSCLVFDEFHYLSDPDRGRIWEETIMLCPRHVQVVCLSATLPNIQELADWMRQQLGTVEVVTETNRPVPLSYHYFAGGELHPALAGERPDPALRRYDVKPGRGPAPNIVDLLPALCGERMTPALAFVFSRRDAERYAGMAASWLAENVPLEAEAVQRISAAVDAIGRQPAASPQAQAIGGCLRQGVGFHHAGLLPELKLLVEQLFGDGLLQLLCATETFALGLNMPARTVVLPRITKFDGRSHRELTAREFQQMAGRAGRRGKDELGHVVLVADPWKPFASVSRLLSAPLEPVRSAFSFSYNTLLNVSSVYGEAAVESIVSSGFLMHQLQAELLGVEAQLADLESGKPAETRQRGSRKQVTELRRRAESLRASVTAGRHRKELEVMRGAVSELGYVASAPKAGLVRGIFDTNALLLAELLEDRSLKPEAIAAPEFAELIGWFAGDRPKQHRGLSIKLGGRLRQLRQLLDEVTTRVQRAERNGGMLLTQTIVPVFPSLICRWCAGEDIGLLSREYQLSEGDITAHVDGTRQLLRQVYRAASGLSTYAALGGLANAALGSLAIRNGPLDEELT